MQGCIPYRRFGFIPFSMLSYMFIDNSTLLQSVASTSITFALNPLFQPDVEVMISKCFILTTWWRTWWWITWCHIYCKKVDSKFKTLFFYVRGYISGYVFCTADMTADMTADILPDMFPNMTADKYRKFKKKRGKADIFAYTVAKAPRAKTVATAKTVVDLAF